MMLMLMMMMMMNDEKKHLGPSRQDRLPRHGSCGAKNYALLAYVLLFSCTSYCTGLMDHHGEHTLPGGRQGPKFSPSPRGKNRWATTNDITMTWLTSSRNPYDVIFLQEAHRGLGKNFTEYKVPVSCMVGDSLGRGRHIYLRALG